MAGVKQPMASIIFFGTGWVGKGYKFMIKTLDICYENVTVYWY